MLTFFVLNPGDLGFMQSNKIHKIVSFAGGETGQWRVLSTTAISGKMLAPAQKLDIIREAKEAVIKTDNQWTLRAVISNLRYTTGTEKKELDKRSRGLGKPEYNYAALIPIRKSEEWWMLPQDERRKIFEEDSHHIQTSAKYLSVISRQLYHSRDIGEDFDFITWFEFAAEHSGQFNELAGILRQTEEWKYVTREVDIRLAKEL